MIYLLNVTYKIFILNYLVRDFVAIFAAQLSRMLCLFSNLEVHP